MAERYARVLAMTYTLADPFMSASDAYGNMHAA